MIETGIAASNGSTHSLLDVRATTPEYLGAGVEDVILKNSPLAAIFRSQERALARGDNASGAPDIRSFRRLPGQPGAPGGLPLPARSDMPRALQIQPPPEGLPSDPKPPQLTPEEANRQYGDIGLKFDAPVAVAEASLLADTKRRELAADAVFKAARAPSFDGGGLGFGRAALSVAVDFLGSAIDPINLASAFVPIVGPPARVALVGSMGRYGGRIAAGAIEGTVGAALVEPILAASAIAEQRDYGWADSFANLALGGVLGGTLHGIGGFLGRNRPDPLSPVAPGGPAAPRPSAGPPPPPVPAPAPGRELVPTFAPYTSGWVAALEGAGHPVPAGAREWHDVKIFDRAAPMVAALEAVSPETRRIAGSVATMQFANGRAIDVEAVLRLDPNWRPPMADPLEQLRQLVDGRARQLMLPALDAPVRRDPLVAPEASGHFADFGPQQLTVDAKRFQFKAGGDQAGVTDRLQGVTKWDQRLAGLSIVWQDKAGKNFVVDGHQRHGLATRLEAKGQAPKIHAVLLKEANGESEGFARALAAYKNIAEGTGTAIDAAKILRETQADPKLRKDLDSGNLPQLPPTSPLVRDAAALAALPDHAFGIVAAGKVEPAHAAHVTRILTDPKQQTSAIELLAKLQPDTSEQARLIVEQIRAAGFVEGHTVDLFGGRDVAESLLLERAKVLEAAARALKRDASVFRTLVEREHVAAEAGNILSRDANLERLSDDKAALAVLEALSNRAGPVATALNEAAKALADGRRLKTVVDNFLTATRAEAAAYRPPAKAAGELGLGRDSEELFRGLDDLRNGAAKSDTLGDPAAAKRQADELERTPKKEFSDVNAIAEAEGTHLSEEARQAIAAHPELQAEIDAAKRAADDADLFGKATDALAACKITGGS